MKKGYYQNHSAFSLIELILYISIMAITITSLSYFLSLSIKSRLKYQSITEVDSQSFLLVQIITKAIRDAESVRTPILGSSGNILSLEMSNASLNPTVFTLSNSTVLIQEGSGAQIPLTNSHITVENLSFINTSKENTEGLIRIEFTLKHDNQENIQEYEYTQTYYATASLRP
jgi:type II secretory pathway pseudopilin PulG